MTPAERGFLLLCSHLGEKRRNPLTTAQVRILADRVQHMQKPEVDREMELQDLRVLGYGPEMARRILSLLAEEYGCIPSGASDYHGQSEEDSLHNEFPVALWDRIYGNWETLLVSQRSF